MSTSYEVLHKSDATERVLMRNSVVLLRTILLVALCTACDGPWDPFGIGAKGFTAVRVGSDHTCALTNDGLAYCWGQNRRGQLGTGDTLPSTLPRRVSTDIRFRALAVAGYGYGGPWSCGISENQSLWCWGNAPFVQERSTTGAAGYLKPTRLMPGVSVSHFRADNGMGLYQCLLSGEGKAYCWGQGYPFRSGGGDAERVATELRFAQIATGSIAYGILGGGESNDLYFRHACAIDAGGRAYCWGTNGFGALGDGTRTSSSAPVEVHGELRFREIHGAPQESFGLAVDGTLFRWGGRYPPDTVTVPTPITDQPVAFRAVAIGVQHNCAIGVDDRAYCWGRHADAYGYLGQGETGITRRTPQPVRTDLAFSTISVGSSHSCGVTVRTRVYCWGSNDHGQLGDGTLVSSSVPVGVGTPQ